MSSSSAQPPTTLGQYQIIREIARSNDIVYEAYDPFMNRRVAVKELVVPGGSTDVQREERIQRFKREAQAAGGLNHPNIMTVYSFAEDAGRPFMAMEYLDGHTLRNEIDTKGFLPTDRAVEIALALLDGLDHAHKKGVIHRDIKPDNVQLLSSGEIKITDFGIARLTFQPNLTIDGQVFGTPSYMSPEQVVGKDIDARSDLFSVGTVLYEMLVGTKPFAGDSVVTITYAIMNKEISQPSQIPYRLWQVIQRSLEKVPAGRYATAGDMANAIRDAQRAQDPDPGYGASSPSYGGAPVPPPVQNYSMPAATPGYTQAPYQNTPYQYPGPAAGNGPAQMPSYGGMSVPNPFAGQGGYTQQPYGQPQGGQPGYTQQPYGMPPPGPLPIYFPPPPRKPLLNAEQSAFLKRLLVTTLIVGTLLCLVAVGISALSEAVKRYNAQQRDQQLVPDALAVDSRTPIPERISALEQYRAKLESVSQQEKVNRDIAVLYQQLGNQVLQDQNGLQAESYFQKSIELDPHNAAYYSSLASLYDGRAEAQNDPDQRTDLWRVAGENWSKAADRETDAANQREYSQRAAFDLYNYAAELSSRNDASHRSEIRQALYEASNRVEGKTDLATQIQALLSTVR